MNRKIIILLIKSRKDKVIIMNDTERIDVIMDELEKTVAMQERCARYYATDAATMMF